MTAQSVARRLCARLAPVAACLSVIAALWSAPSVAAGGADLPIQLEVFINDQPTNLIGGFTEAGGELACSPQELADLGLVLPEALRKRALVALKDIPGLSYRYERARQTVHLAVSDALRKRHELDARASASKRPPVEHGTGAVLNYALIGTLSDDSIDNVRFNPAALKSGFAAQLDGRIFTPRGKLEASVIARTGLQGEGDDVVRLDTAWTCEDPETLRRWRFGDTVSGGLSWTRPIRLGGVQLQRSFDLRPDLIAAPLPSISGSAAVPSTVDVYINNVKSFSQAVPAGPFSVTNLPIVSGAGTARLVVRDAAGRETTSEQAFFSSATLLAPGLYDYSLEGGVARRNYGILSDDYGGGAIFSASGRYGWSRQLTLEAHAEGGAGLANAGIGAATAIGRYAVLSGAISASTFEGKPGTKLFAALETQLLGLTFAAQSQRTFGNFMDLAGATADESETELGLHGLSARPLRSLDLVSVGAPVAATKGNVNVSLIEAGHVDGSRQRIVSASYSQQIADRVSFFAAGFMDMVDDRVGAFAGLSIGLGGGHLLSAGLSYDEKGAGFTTDYMKSSSLTPGSVGWRATVTRGASERTSGHVDWTTDVARVEVTANGTQNTAFGTMVVTGAVAAAGGGLFLANRIDDAFAVVDAGAPAVDVLHENRKVGTTRSDGLLLVPGLRSNQLNRIAIDPLTLPLDVEAPQTRRDLVPATGTGIVVAMRGRPVPAAAIVVLRDPSGAPIPVGSAGVLEGTGEAFVVGYEGEAYLRGLGASNRLTVDINGRTCNASFPYARAGEVQGRIEGVICR